MEGAPLRSRLRQNHLRRQDHTDVLGVDCPGGLQRHKSLRLFAAEVVGLARICFEIERLSKGDSAFGFSRVCGAWERAFLLKRPVLFMNFERRRFSFKKFAGDRSDFSFCRGSFRGPLRTLFNQLPKLFGFSDVVVIHSLTYDVIYNIVSFG
jgi:hypothetical protein